MNTPEPSTTSSSPSSDVRIGLLGCGGWGSNHLRVWAELGHLHAVADPDPGRLAHAAQVAPGVHQHMDWRDLIERDDIDGVVIATPAVTHADIAIAAIKHGKHVLVEKPMATTLADAERIKAAADDAGLQAMVGHVLEYHPAAEAMVNMVSDGALGRLRYVYSNRLNFGKLRTEENALWSFAPHDIAMLLHIAGRSPQSVSCTGHSYLNPKVADVTLMQLDFGEGVSGHVFVSWLHPFKEQRLVVVGSEAMAVFDDTAPWEEKLAIYSHNIDWIDGRIPAAVKAEASYVDLPKAEPLTEECRAFVKSIASNSPARTDAAQGVEVLRVLEAGENSMNDRGSNQSLAVFEPEYFTHESAIVDDGAKIGRDSKIWHYCHVSPGAQIGERVVLGQNVYVAATAKIGNGVKIQNNVAVYDAVELEDDVFCGPSMVFTNVTNPRAFVERKDEYKPTLVKKGASLGANCTIVCGATIGRYALVGAGAVVTNDVADNAVVAGVPARQTGWVTDNGDLLDFGDGTTATCPRTGDAYSLSEGRLQKDVS